MRPSQRTLSCGVALLGTALLGSACGEVRADAVVAGTLLDPSTGGSSPRPNEDPAGGAAGAGSQPTTSEPEPEPEPDPDPDPVEPPAIAGELCSPCERSEECGGSGDYCLVYRGVVQYYCGRHCDAEAICPEGYECIPLQNAPEIEQCIPISRTCPPEL